MQICLDNSNNSMLSYACTERTWYAGKCAGIKEIISFGDMYGKEKEKDKDSGRYLKS